MRGHTAVPQYVSRGCTVAQTRVHLLSHLLPPHHPQPASDPGQGVLTMGALQLSHGRHERALGYVALHGWHERLLVRRVQRLGELDRLQGGQAAAHAVDDGHALGLSRGQAWGRRTGVSQASPTPQVPCGTILPPQSSEGAPWDLPPIKVALASRSLSVSL